MILINISVKMLSHNDDPVKIELGQRPRGAPFVAEAVLRFVIDLLKNLCGS